MNAEEKTIDELCMEVKRQAEVIEMCRIALEQFAAEEREHGIRIIQPTVEGQPAIMIDHWGSHLMPYQALARINNWSDEQ